MFNLKLPTQILERYEHEAGFSSIYSARDDATVAWDNTEMSGEHPEPPPRVCVMDMAGLRECNVQAALYKALLHLKLQEGINTRHKFKTKNKEKVQGMLGDGGETVKIHPQIFIITGH